MKILWASLIACATAVTYAAIWAAACNGLGPWGAFFSSLTALLCAIAAFYTCQPEKRTLPSKCEWLILLIFAIISFRSFFWLLYPSHGALHVLSPYNLGDLALHMQLIQYCALGAPFWPESPILTSTPLVYPVGMDLLNAILLLLGAPLIPSLIWVGSIGAGLSALALWRWGGGFAVAAFLFAGGASEFPHLATGHFDFLQEHTEWKNLFLSMWVTQRGLLYALPAGLALLYEWNRELQPNKREVPIWLQAGIYITLPLFHVHTFLFLTFVLVSGFFLSGDPRIRKYILTFLLISAIPTTIAIWCVTGGFYGGTALRFLPGWMQDDHPWKFWWDNFGILPILWLILFFIPSVYRDPASRCLLFAASFTFLCCCFFSITPWAWDNTKFMLWAYLAIIPLLWKYLLHPLFWPFRALLCMLLFFSGAISLFGGLKSPGYALISLTELRDVEASLISTPPLSRFAAAPDYNHPIALAGHKRVVGYEGHLWSHGLPYLPVLENFNHLMNGESNWKSLARKLKVDFLFWGPREESRYPHSKKPWLTQCPIISQSPQGVIYDVRL